MRIIITLALLAFMTAPAVIISTSPAIAQNFGEEFNEIAELNRIKPLQNPRYQKADRIVGRRLVDSKNKVLGKIHDVIMNGRGSITSLYASFDRLQLSQKVYLNYNTMKIRPATQSYRMAYDAKQVRNIYPEILSQTVTASGNSADDISLQNMIRKNIYNEKGIIIGRVNTVLFGYDGDRAEAIHIEMRKKTMRGKTIAVPFNAVKFSSTDGSIRATIAQPYESAMIDFLK